jgi:hypothetical protein
MKKTYFAPETTLTSVEIESLLQNLSNQGGGNWTQGPVGDDDPEDPTEDDGRAKATSIWD